MVKDAVRRNGVAEDRNAWDHRAFLPPRGRPTDQAIVVPLTRFVVENPAVPALARETSSIARHLLIRAASRQCAPDLEASRSIGTEVDEIALVRKGGEDVVSQIARDLSEAGAG